MELTSNSVRPAVRDYLQQHRLPKLSWVAYFKKRRDSTSLAARLGRAPFELVLRPWVTRVSSWPKNLVTHGQGGPAALAVVELLRGQTLKATIRCTDTDESELIFSSCRRGGILRRQPQDAGRDTAYPCRLKI